MSGRPANPSYTPIVWDTGNYPIAGKTWDSTPKRTDPTYRSFTPVTLIAPQFYNFFFGAAFDVQASQKTDATNLANLVGQGPALNWFPKTTSSSTKNCNRGAFSVVDQGWFIVGNGGTDFAAVSYDYGRTWADLATASSTALVDVAVDSSGNVVFIATATRSTTKCTRTAYATFTFATTASALTVSPSGGALTFDSSHTKFVACYRNGTSGHKVDTSANGTAWRPQTIPAPWTAYTGTNSPQVHAHSSGTTIANFFDDGTGFLRIMRSTDGGTTWTATAAINSTFAPSLVHRAAYDSTNSVWYIAYATTAGSRQTEIIRSTDDGQTWAIFKTFTGTNDLFCNGFQCLGALLVMTNDDGRMCWSIDGTNWLWVGRNPQTSAGTASTPLGLRAGGGGFLLLNATDRVAYASVRFGNEGQAV